ncbi:FAD-binding oxidoreductase [Hydrogenovibrio sp. 3SP14C1]|uniref:2Fe-2S iron-sulfur cluster-binding protein n=1 Tax=Hydrogenovibrio sp. 3SP14C1 TaxID=3038774 RepID=UPI002417CB21|nr:2Fe-2S iron-sulfur cluster-binding protein [Hydrogenovibrio sp. 3SP14C1]MDG4812257.1 FAD-binding oxidoreductase [Hydrogenovibrio sp. 3SP14C1]
MNIQITMLEKKIFSGKEDKSILESALDAGLVFEYSCKTGQCGVCKTTLLSGEIAELQDQIALTLEDKKNHKVLTCCCAPKTDILIDAEDLSALHGIETKTLPARINAIEKYTAEHVEVTLRLPPSANFKFLEGQYLDVLWNNLRRSYSIASTANQKEITLLIKRFENGKMSDYWFNKAKENDLLRIEGPKGTFFLRDTSMPLIFLATGTGIAPIISILESLDANQEFKQKQSITVYWGNRYPEAFIWQPRFKKLDINFVKVCSKPNEDWDDEKGYVQDAALAEQSSMVRSAVYACGSNAMIQSSKAQFMKAGLPEKQFYSDAFVQSY